MLNHLSPSTVQSYRTCAKRVYFEKVLGIPNWQVHAMTVYGTCMHHAIEQLYLHKLSKEDFKTEFIKKFTELESTITVWKSDTATSLIIEGGKACDEFYDTIYPQFNVVETEKEYKIDRGEGHLPITCFADGITDNKEIIDYKFGRGMTGTSDSKGYRCNMVTYAWAYYNEHGELPEAVTFIKQVWGYKKDKETGQRIFHHKGFVIDRKEVFISDLDFYQEVYQNVEQGVMNNVWLPAPDDSFFCKGCGYRIKGHCNKKSE